MANCKKCKYCEFIRKEYAATFVGCKQFPYSTTEEAMKFPYSQGFYKPKYCSHFEKRNKDNE